MTRGPRTGHRYRQAVLAVRRRAALGEPCCLCKLPIDVAIRYPDPQSCTLQHVEQLAAGGSLLDPSNHAPAHLVCNSRDSARARGGTRSPLQPNPSMAW